LILNASRKISSEVERILQLAKFPPQEIKIIFTLSIPVCVCTNQNDNTNSIFTHKYLCFSNLFPETLHVSADVSHHQVYATPDEG
jgi:hypothetical protein